MSTTTGLGERIRERMAGLGYARSDGSPKVLQFSRDKGYFSQYVYQWLLGRVPGPENLQRLARDLGVSRAWLLFGDAGVAEVRRLEPVEPGGRAAPEAPGRRALKRRSGGQDTLRPSAA